MLLRLDVKFIYFFSVTIRAPKVFFASLNHTLYQYINRIQFWYWRIFQHYCKFSTSQQYNLRPLRKILLCYSFNLFFLDYLVITFVEVKYTITQFFYFFFLGVRIITPLKRIKTNE